MGMAMPNFTAQVRTSFRDVAGLVLSCGRQDIIQDPDNPGYAKEWINRAPGLPSIPMIRYPGDAVTYQGARFTNPRQPNQLFQPGITFTGGGDPRLVFDRSAGTHMFTQACPSIIASALDHFAFAYQVTPGADVSNNQTMFTDEPSNTIKFSRRDAAGDSAAKHGASTLVVAGDHPSAAMLYTVLNAQATWTRYDLAYGGPFGTAITQIPADSTFFIGGEDGSNYYDGIMDSLHVWVSKINARTRDFILQTMSEDGGDYAASTRAPMSKPIWRDVTNDVALGQIQRVRPIDGRDFRYILGSLPSATPHLVQLAAATDGVARQDSELGGDLFTWEIVEKPASSGAILSGQDANWSSVIDLTIDTEGHYCIYVWRTDGGGIYLHFDIEVA